MADIHRGEAWEYEWRLERKEEFTGELEPLPLESVINAWLSATYKGDAITPRSVLALTRRELDLRFDGRLLWFAILEADPVTEALAAIATGDPIFEVCEIDGERKSRELTVAD